MSHNPRLAVLLINALYCTLGYTLWHLKLKGTGRSEEVEISRNITFSEKILIESCGI